MSVHPILVVENISSEIGAITGMLREHGLDVATAMRRELPALASRRRQFSVVVLDTGSFPSFRFEKVSQVRADLNAPLIVILRQDADAESRARALDHGADDCLAKPLSATELAARVRAQLRRNGHAAWIHQRIGGIELDLESRRVTRREGEIALTPREFDLFAYLARHLGTTVTRDMLARDVWREPHRATSLDNVIDVHMTHLRHKIDDPQAPSLLHTVRGQGYVLGDLAVAAVPA